MTTPEAEGSLSLEEELADALAGLPTPTVVEPTWYTSGAPGSAIPSVFTTPDGRTVPPAQVYVGFSTPAGGATSAPYTNRQRYTAKSYQWTGRWFDWDEWSQAAALRHRWHGFGPTWPGQSASTPASPSARTARPALSPVEAVPIPTLIDQERREV